MNKTITMNLSGIIFHIEEDAYDKLSKYLSTIKSYFQDSDGRDEIMTDIEARIAEMLQEKVSAAKQGVLMSDVDHVISVMGRPEDFAGDSAAEQKEEKKVQPEQEIHVKKRVFRDPDDRLLGGVCSGIANYFDFDPLWLRLGFVLSVFFLGTGILLYIILWIVIPQAKTTAEKLQMKGEKVNISNIEKSVKEEFEQFKGKAGEMRSEAAGIVSKGKVRTATDKFVDFITDVFGSLFKVLGKIIAVLFIIIGTFVVIFLFSSLFGGSNTIHISHDDDVVSYSIYEFFSSVLIGNQQLSLAIIGTVLFFGVPFIMLVYQGVKMLFGIKTHNKMVRIVAVVLWLGGIATLTYTGFSIADEFAQEANHGTPIEIQQPAGGTLFLKLKSDKKYDYDNEEGYESRVSIGKWNMVKTDKNKVHFGFPQLDIVASESDSFELVAIKSARGTTKKEAVARARNIEYTIVQRDSVIEFSPNFEMLREDKWRDQEVQLVLKVPRDKVVFLDRSTRHFIYDIDNVTDTWDGDMVGRRWKMTAAGLACVDCKGLEEHGKRSHKARMREIMEEIERDIKRDMQKIREEHEYHPSR